jgi:hypothetical protein
MQLVQEEEAQEPLREASLLKVRELQYPIVQCQSTLPDFLGKKSVILVLVGLGDEDEELVGRHLASCWRIPR